MFFVLLLGIILAINSLCAQRQFHVDTICNVECDRRNSNELSSTPDTSLGLKLLVTPSGNYNPEAKIEFVSTIDSGICRIGRRCGYYVMDEYAYSALPGSSSLSYSSSEAYKPSGFEEGILDKCGPLGHNVSLREILELLRENDRELDELFVIDNLGVDRKYFANKLAFYLYKNNAFTNIFCGRIKGTKLSGPHYLPRILSLLKDGVISVRNVSENNKVGVCEISFLGDDGNVSNKYPVSFGKEMRALDILKVLLTQTDNSKERIELAHKLNEANEIDVVVIRKQKMPVTMWPIAQDMG